MHVMCRETSLPARTASGPRTRSKGSTELTASPCNLMLIGVDLAPAPRCIDIDYQGLDIRIFATRCAIGTL